MDMKTILYIVIGCIVGTQALVAGPGNRVLWSPVEWTSCENIVAPWGATVNDIYSGLRRNGVIGAKRDGDISLGTFSITIDDSRRNEQIQLTFDAVGRLNGAATWHSTSSANNAREFVLSLTGRLAADGAKVVARYKDGAELRAVCDGNVVTINVGIDSEDNTKAFVTIMSTSASPASKGITENR
jgi:hypothetical protein